MAADFLLGIDGGGTKTALCAVCPELGRVLRARTGSASWREKGIAVLAGELKAAADALVSGGHIRGAVLGMPCYGESAADDPALSQALASAFPGVPLHVVNDAEVGWAGSLALQSGVNVVAGTGTIAFGRDAQGRTARSGGWDEFYSDEGSGYWLGRGMLQLFTKQSDGRAPRGPLHRIVRKAFSLSDDMQIIGLVRKHCLGSRSQVAALQRLLLAAAREGDADAVALYRDTARELFAMARAVYQQLQLPPKGWLVSLSGGLTHVGALLTDPFAALAKEAGAAAVKARYSPAEGAVLLAAERYLPERIQALMRLFNAKQKRACAKDQRPPLAGSSPHQGHPGR